MNSKRKANKKLADEAKGQEAHERAVREWTALPNLKLGDFVVPKFEGISTVFGADISEYPPMEMIPPEFKSWSGRYPNIVSSLFFKGGKFEDHGIRLKPNISKMLAMSAIRAWMCSFAPKHEHKTATVAWALSQWTEDLS